MADRLPPQAQRISGISCVGLALDSNSYLTRHSFQQIGHPTAMIFSRRFWPLPLAHLPIKKNKSAT